MKTTITFLSFFILNFGFSQAIGTYDFTGISICPNENPNVVSQPTNAVFSAMSTTGADCAATANFYNTTNWEASPNFNPDKYNEFTLTSNVGFSANLLNLTFTHRVSSLNATWYVRSSVDNYTADLATGIDTNILVTSVVPLGANFTNLNAVTFRFYVNKIADAQRTWRMDDVILNGAIVSSNSLSENELSNTLAIFPNPSNDFISFTKNKVNAVKIFNLEGKLIFSNENQNGIEQVNISTLEKGNYFVELSQDGKVSTHRFLKN